MACKNCQCKTKEKSITFLAFYMGICFIGLLLVLISFLPN